MSDFIRLPSVLITLADFVLFQILIGFMKLVSLRVNSWPEDGLKFLLVSPVPSFRTWKNRSGIRASRLLMTVGVLFTELIALTGFYLLPSDLFPSNWHWILQSYLVIVPFVVLVDAAGRLVRVMYGVLGVSIPHIHANFLTVTRVSDFWNHWNVWFADFFEETCFRSFLRRPMVGMILAFGLSGIIHEYLGNIPLYWVYERNLFGTMMLYFLIQGFGVWGERTLLPDSPGFKRIWTWLVVLLPVPLVLNLATLRIFHLGFFG